MSFPSSPERPPRAVGAAEVRALVLPAAARVRAPAEEEPAAILDVRAEAAFAGGHLAASGHIPADALAGRRAELPPRHQPVIVVAETAAAARTAADTLRALGYADVSWLDAPILALGDEAMVRGEPLRLWRPAEFLAQVVESVPRGPAADLAAGSGREAAFLAERGFDVEAWDEAPEALQRASDLARRANTTIRTCAADLESRSFTLPERRYALITGFRFLHRPLIPRLVEALIPGGFLIAETTASVRRNSDGRRTRDFCSTGGRAAPAMRPAPRIS